MLINAQSRRFASAINSPVTLKTENAGVPNPMMRNTSQTILVVNDVEPTRRSIEAMLTGDGYLVETARDESDASSLARFSQPDLMLVSLDGETGAVIETVRRIRERAALGENVPVIIFCVGELKDGNEIAAGRNIYLAHPDNFNQLRSFISRLLLQS